MKEEHHIVPICMGGKDEAENIILLSAQAHAIISILQSEHYGVCCFHGRQKKFLPPSLHKLADKWIKAASEMATFSRLLKLEEDPQFKQKFCENISDGLRKMWKDPDHCFRRLDKLRENQKFATEAAMGPEARGRQKESFRLIEHQKGEKNSQFGTIWITDGTKEGNKKILRGDPIPEGFKPGRVLK